MFLFFNFLFILNLSWFQKKKCFLYEQWWWWTVLYWTSSILMCIITLFRSSYVSKVLLQTRSKVKQWFRERHKGGNDTLRSCIITTCNLNRSGICHCLALPGFTFCHASLIHHLAFFWEPYPLVHWNVIMYANFVFIDTGFTQTEGAILSFHISNRIKNETAFRCKFE